MKRAASPVRRSAILCAALALAACSGPGAHGPRGHTGPRPGAHAEPGQIVAIELAFARMAQEEGQWTAFAHYAAPDAMMYVPEPVQAQEWLKGRANPPQAVQWDVHQVWSSCDGSTAATTGAWRNGDQQGWFSTVWQRQEDGSFKWIVDQGDTTPEAEPEPDMIGAKIASCDNLDAISPPFLPVPATEGTRLMPGDSGDKTLRWITRYEPDGTRYFGLEYWNGSEFERPVARFVTPAEAGE